METNNLLLEKVTALCSSLPRGALLDLGCGDGVYAERLQALGFDVTAADGDAYHFKLHNRLRFQQCDISNPLPFGNATYDYVLLLEVIEHVWFPGHAIREIARILKPGGTLILSTPNILSLTSRLRFVFEGSFDFFREPLIEYARHRQDPPQMHVIPWRYQELEYLLAEHGLHVTRTHTDHVQPKARRLAPLLLPLIWCQARLKEWRTTKGGVDYKRINGILLSPELLYGRHLIVQASKAADSKNCLQTAAVRRGDLLR